MNRNSTQKQKQNIVRTQQPSGLVNPESGDDGTAAYIAEVGKTEPLVHTTVPVHGNMTIHDPVVTPVVRDPLIFHYNSPT